MIGMMGYFTRQECTASATSNEVVESFLSSSASFFTKPDACTLTRTITISMAVMLALVGISVFFKCLPLRGADEAAMPLIGGHDHINGDVNGDGDGEAPAVLPGW
jgi:hypothetical protein